MGTSDGNGFGTSQEQSVLWPWYATGNGQSWVFEEGCGHGRYDGDSRPTGYTEGIGAGNLDY